MLKYAWQASLVEQPTLPGLGLQACCSLCYAASIKTIGPECGKPRSGASTAVSKACPRVGRSYAGFQHPDGAERKRSMGRRAKGQGCERGTRPGPEPRTQENPPMTKAASTPQTHPASARNHPPRQVDAATKAMSARSRRVYRSKALPPISPAAALQGYQAPRGASFPRP